MFAENTPDDTEVTLKLKEVRVYELTITKSDYEKSKYDFYNRDDVKEWFEKKHDGYMTNMCDEEEETLYVDDEVSELSIYQQRLIELGQFAEECLSGLNEMRKEKQITNG